MKPKMIIGIVLIALGVGVLAYQGITYTSREKIIDIGSIQATHEASVVHNELLDSTQADIAAVLWPVFHLEISSLSLSSAVRTLEETERNQIDKIISETRWRIVEKDGTSAILGLHPSTLRARMHTLGVVRPETKEPH